jgi:hypothetical protein
MAQTTSLINKIETKDLKVKNKFTSLSEMYLETDKNGYTGFYNINSGLGSSTIAAVETSNYNGSAVIMNIFGPNFDEYTWADIDVANWGIVYAYEAGGLLIATSDSPAPIVFSTADTEHARFGSSSTFTLSTDLVCNGGATLNSTTTIEKCVILGSAPNTNTATGLPGQIKVATNSAFLYVCIATNTWTRVATSNMAFG